MTINQENETALVIFCDDFRIRDNPALSNACKDYENIIPLFIFDENYQGKKIGAAARVFLHYSLKNFDKALQEKYGANLILRKGDKFEQLKKIATEIDFKAIYFNKSYSKKEIETEEKIHKCFKDKTIKSFKAKILFDPKEIKTGKGEYFKVFTPFFKEAMRNLDLIGEYLKAPRKINCQHSLKSLELKDLNLVPEQEGVWPEKLVNYWEFDFDKIDNKIKCFLQNKLKNYKEERNRTDLDATSNLSPYFRFGLVSPRIVFNAAQNYDNNNHFLSEICWREYAYHVYHFNQDLENKEIRQEYSKFAWQNNSRALKKWQKGETGFEIVDAAMKEIYASGIMHNRARMIVASFLIKDLLIDWRKGEEYFWDCLIDADFAVNAFSWQWVFGSGFDAAPYFRVFNPELQEEKFDPKGEYRQKWLGNRMKIEKIVDHKKQRDIVLNEYKRIKGE